MTDENTISELGRSLHNCADYLRGSVDGGEFKDYILPLVFYAEINRRFTVEYDGVLTEAGFERGAEDSDLDEAIRDIASESVVDGIVVPHGHSWEAIVDTNSGVATTIDDAFDAFEEENEEYEQIFDTAYARNSSLTGESGDATLRKVLQTIDEAIYQSNKDMSYDMIGEAFMFLVKKFATEEGGEYFTPTRVVRLVVELIEPFDPGAKIHDPTSGSGGMLVEASNEIHRRWANGFYDANYDDIVEADEFREFIRNNGYNFTGQEKNPKIAGMGQMNLALHNLDGEIKHGDSLTNPKFTKSESELKTFDYILANFPFSVKGWKTGTEARAETYGDMDWADKLPHGNRGDFAFIMHMHSHLADDGRLATVIPHGVLFRNSENPFREYMVENDLVEAVIGLPSNVFESTGIPSAILVLNNNKPEHRKDEIMFFNADHEGRFYRDTGSDRNVLIDPIADGVESDVSNHPIYSEMSSPEGTAEVKQLFDSWDDEERVCRVVSTEEVQENEYNMNIALYVDTTEPQEDISVSETLSTIHALETEYESLNNQLTTYMQQLNYEGETDD